MDEREGSAVDRRRFIKGAATVAWATPLILTLGSASAQAQVSPPNCLGASNRPEGCPCTASAQCADGCCCTAPGGPGGGCTSVSNCGEFPGSVCL